MNNTLSATTTEQVQEILIDQLGIERAQVCPSADIRGDLGADSLDIVEIGMKAEEVFNLIIPDDDMEKIHTVGDLYEALASLLERTGQPM